MTSLMSVGIGGLVPPPPPTHTQNESVAYGCGTVQGNGGLPGTRTSGIPPPPPVTLRTPGNHEPVLFKCWASLAAAVPALKQHWFNVSCSLGHQECSTSVMFDNWLPLTISTREIASLISPVYGEGWDRQAAGVPILVIFAGPISN